MVRREMSRDPLQEWCALRPGSHDQVVPISPAPVSRYRVVRWYFTRPCVTQPLDSLRAARFWLLWTFTVAIWMIVATAFWSTVGAGLLWLGMRQITLIGVLALMFFATVFSTIMTLTEVAIYITRQPVSPRAASGVRAAK